MQEHGFYEVGDYVEVKDYNRLVEEFGVDEDGNVRVQGLYFNPEMEKYCGNKYRITFKQPLDTRMDYHLNSCGDWWFCDGMLEDCDNIFEKSDELDDFLSGYEKGVGYV